MTIRSATFEDLALAIEWAAGHGRTATLPESNGEDHIGCVVEDETGPLAMAWLYEVPKRGLCYVEDLVIRPGVPLSLYKRGGAMLLAGLRAAAKNAGYCALLAYSLPSSARFLAAIGWEVADERAKIAMTIRL